MTTRSSRSLVLGAPLMAVLAGAAVLSVTPSASATPGIRNAFTARYPTSTLIARTQAATGNACYACHQPPNNSSAGNCYREALSLRIAAGRSNAQAVADVELLDSDGDGVSNRDEILAVRADMPGEVGYNPGLVGATGTDPCGANVNTPVTGQRETPPPPSCHADFNGDGFLDFFDYDDYVSCFETGTCPPGTTADFNGDGFADFFDYDDFVAAFQNGC